MYDLILQYLLSKDFTQNENKFVKQTQVIVGQQVINGHVQVMTKNIDFEIEYIGDGWIGKDEQDNTPTTQWRISDGEGVLEVIVQSLEEFKSYIEGKV